jgi:hypothetical protein
MCVQTINTEEDCLYLTFLDNCGEDRAYPPLNLYENDDFVYINADDNKQISISKVGFIVDINGVEFTDKDLAMSELAVQISCVNLSRTGGDSSDIESITEGVEKIVEQLSERELVNFIDLTNSQASPWGGFPMTVNEFQWSDGTFFPPTGYPIAPAVVVNNVQELVNLWNANVLDNKLSVRDATSVFILPGSAPVPTDINANISIVADAPIFTLSYIKTSSWGTEPDAENSAVNNIEDKVTQLADGGETLVSSENGIATYNVPGNTAIVLVTEENKRENVFLQCHSLSLWVRLKPAASVPNNREGYLVKAGGDINISTLGNGQKYFGEISLINAADGEQPTYSLSVLNRP